MKDVAVARLFLIVPLVLASCAHQPAPVIPPGSRPVVRSSRVHVVGPRTPAKPARPSLAEKEVLLAQEAFLSKSPGSNERAAALYRSAAVRGSAVAEYNLGVFYEDGIGVRSDRREAAAWYKRAINNHDPAVQTLASGRLRDMGERSRQQSDSD